MTTLERDAETAGLRDLLVEVVEGDGRVCVIEGPAGIGKTLLLDELRGLAGDFGFEVALARCAALEQSFGFGVVRQLLEPLIAERDPDERSAILAGVSEATTDALGLQSELADVATPSFSTMHGLWTVCQRLAEHRPLVLAVDDAQWCDEASARFLAYAASRSQGVPVAIALTVRTAATGALATDPVLALSALPGTRVLRPEPLSADAAHRLTAELLGVEPDEAFIAALLEATGGVPFLLRSLLVAVQRDGIEPTAEGARRIEDVVPDAVSRMVLLRLRGLPDAALPVARAAAVLAPAGSLSLAAEVAGVDRAEAGEAVDALVAAGILDADPSLRFVHPLIAAAVEMETPPGELSRLHARAARCLHAAGEPFGRVAAHLLAADAPGDSWALAVLERAAREALERGAPLEAAALWQRALVDGPPEDRVRLLIELGRAQARADPKAAVQRLSEALAEADPATADHARAGRELGHTLLELGRVRKAARVLKAAAEESRYEGDARVALESELLSVLRWDADLSTELPARLERNVKRSEKGDRAARLLLAQRCYSASLLGEPAPHVLELARRAHDGGRLLRDLGPEAQEVLLVGNALTGADLQPEAIEVFTEIVDASAKYGSAIGYQSGRCWRAVARLSSGDLAGAEEDLYAAASVAAEQGWIRHPSVLGYLIRTQVAEGDLAGAAASLSLAEGDGMLEIPPPTAFHIPLLFGRATLHEARREDEQARDCYLAAGEALLRFQIPSPGAMAWRSSVARMALNLGDAEQARELAEEELRLARKAQIGRGTGVALHAVALTGPRERAEATLREAAEILAEADPLAEADALLSLGGLLRAERRVADAREPLRRALHLAHELGAAGLEERVRSELAAAGSRPRRAAAAGFDALTPAERRVCELAATGLSNRRIAEELFLTSKTVEMHLTRVYRKLDIKSRAELPAALKSA